MGIASKLGGPAPAANYQQGLFLAHAGPLQLLHFDPYTSLRASKHQEGASSGLGPSLEICLPIPVLFRVPQVVSTTAHIA